MGGMVIAAHVEVWPLKVPSNPKCSMILSFRSEAYTVPDPPPLGKKKKKSQQHPLKKKGSKNTHQKKNQIQNNPIIKQNLEKRARAEV